MKTEQRKEIRGWDVTGETEEETGLLLLCRWEILQHTCTLMGMIQQSGNVKDAGGGQPLAGEQRQNHGYKSWLPLVRSTNTVTGGKTDYVGIDTAELADVLGAHECFLDESIFQ